MLWLWMESEGAFYWLTTSLSGAACAAAALCITMYQRHLSPRKGFCCAHRALYHRHSCSEYVKRAVMRRGLCRAVPLVRRRFAACRAACHSLQFAGERRKEERGRRNRPPVHDCSPQPENGCAALDCSANSGRTCLSVADASFCDSGIDALCPCGCSVW